MDCQKSVPVTCNVQEVRETYNIQRLLSDLKSCGKEKNLQRGKDIHQKVVKSGQNSNIYVVNALINMYGKCGSMVDAQTLFDSAGKRNVVSWNALILGYAVNGNANLSLDFFDRMKKNGLMGNSVTYLAVIKACTYLGINETEDDAKRGYVLLGRKIHVEIGYHLNLYVQGALINMYAKCGSMVDAHNVFKRIQNPDLVSWNTLILGYANNGEGYVALDLFNKLKSSGFAVDCVTYVAVVKACTSIALNGDIKGCLERGKHILVEIGCDIDDFVKAALIEMYANCGSMPEAHKMFDSIKKANVVPWTSLIMGYAENGEGRLALSLFAKMKAAGCIPDCVTYIAGLKACTSLALEGDDISKKNCLERGREMHLEIGSQTAHYVMSTLIDMYAKCGSMFEARSVFDKIKKPSVVSWNALLLGYAENGMGQTALDLFSRMKLGKCRPNSLTYVSALKSCISFSCTEDDTDLKGVWLERVREIHLDIRSKGDNHLLNTLIDIYGKCGSMVDARLVFDTMQKPDLVSWNVLISGYTNNGQGLLALDVLTWMKSAGFTPDSMTYVAALKACTTLNDFNEASLKTARNIHMQIGSTMDNHIYSTLIDVYAKCGSMVDARIAFDDIQKPDLVCYNALIQGYAENEEGHVAVNMFCRMKAAGFTPNPITYLGVLKACSSIGALSLGRKFHLSITDFTPNVVSCLIDFYGKCGSMVEAREVFDTHSRAREISSWNALLGGFCRFGDTHNVFKLLKTMEKELIRPNDVSFLCILLCCSHAGLVENASKYFEEMQVQYGLIPTVMHWNCMVDVLGRANQLNRAVKTIQEMPCKPDTVTWMTVLGACCKWKNVEIGMKAFHALVDIGKNNASTYVLMGQLYGRMEKWF